MKKKNVLNAIWYAIASVGAINFLGLISIIATKILTALHSLFGTTKSIDSVLTNLADFFATTSFNNILTSILSGVLIVLCALTIWWMQEEIKENWNRFTNWFFPESERLT